jgi:hypothetical protein
MAKKVDEAGARSSSTSVCGAAAVTTKSWSSFDMAADRRQTLFSSAVSICVHGRHDDSHHAGDRQAIALDHRYGPTPPWHDVQLGDGPAQPDPGLDPASTYGEVLVQADE